jgi:hypothetical protein
MQNMSPVCCLPIFSVGKFWAVIVSQPELFKQEDFKQIRSEESKRSHISSMSGAI